MVAVHSVTEIREQEECRNNLTNFFLQEQLLRMCIRKITGYILDISTNLASNKSFIRKSAVLRLGNMIKKGHMISACRDFGLKVKETESRLLLQFICHNIDCSLSQLKV